MLELELLNLLNEYKQTSTEYDRNKIKNSIKKLISQNKSETELFIQKPEIENWAKVILEECEKSLKEPNEINDSENDFDLIKKAYKKWLEEYKTNSKELTQKNEQIINELINFYLPNRFETLKSVLEIKDTQDYEDFKGHLSNLLRAHFANKLKNYLESENYNSLSFFKKIKKKRKIEEITKKIIDYKFNQNEIEEIIK